MAEVLGIVAGAAQLLDLSTRVLVASSSLYGKLKNIPDEIETLKKNTELFIDLLWMISSDFDGPINSQVHSLHVTHRMTSILHDARKESEELALLLEGLSANSSSSMRRKWSAVVSATKEKDIAERCRRIKSFKSTLQLWYQHQSNAGLRRVEQQLSQVTIYQKAAHANMNLLVHQTSSVVDLNRAIANPLDSCENHASSLDGPLGHRRRQPRRNGALCTCRPSNSSTSLSIYGLQLFYSQETSHSPNCPLRDGSISWSCGVRALSPKIQMMVGIQLGGWTLSMVGRLSPHNVVDPDKSPAFIALKEARSAMTVIMSQSRKRRVQLHISGPWHTEPVWTGLTVQEQVKSLFHTLLQKLRESFESGTASPGDHTLGNFTLLHAEEHDQYPAHVATIQRSEARLSLLLMQNKIDLKTKTPSILGLAVGWTAGLQILLDAGANPDDAILTAIWEDHLPSIELLIDNGCSLFDLDRHLVFYPRASEFDALFFAASIPASSDVVCLLIQKLVERRLELQQLASNELPEACLKRLGLHKHDHFLLSPDYNAPEVFRQLEAHKVQVPRSLWPGSLTTLYHHPGMTCTLAERLYDAGFCNIDELDEKVYSPLIKTILDFDPRKSILLAQWYLRKGCQLPRSLAYVDFLDQARTLTGCIPARVWITKDARLFGPLGMFQELHPEGVEQRDSCRCWCSTSGCTPVGIVLGQSRFFADRQLWLFNLARYSSLGLSLDKGTFADICRLEVFDRLGMAHTCFHNQCDSYDSGDDYYSGNDCGDDSSERGEVQEEDYHLKQALDSYLELYLCLLHTHVGCFEAFWIVWWIALEYFLPFETKSIYYDRRPLELDNVCDPQSYDEAQSHDSYEPNVEAIMAFIADSVPQLSSETRARFWDQFKPTEDELRYCGLPIDDDSLIIDGDRNDSG
ncbi:hypothetical protein NCS56_00887500 [Fusarium sp. Ph1]|nr:hypothetical protein NCS56_00887500 [Fusarium sp. Ph1]